MYSIQYSCGDCGHMWEGISDRIEANICPLCSNLVYVDIENVERIEGTENIDMKIGI